LQSDFAMRHAQKSSANLSERAYEQLKAMAVTYQLRPGERLAELDLAKRRLVTEGFLTFTPNRGFQCRPLDAKEIFDLYEVRRSLEAASARLAVERASDDELEDLARFLERSRAVPEMTTVMELVRLDEEFHERIAVLSRNADCASCRTSTRASASAAGSTWRTAAVRRRRASMPACWQL
jgi:DNA-binding GntR family transcriptional regulator